MKPEMAKNRNAETDLRRAVNREVVRGEAPARILIVPWGIIESLSGGFILDAEAARLTIEAFGAHGVDLPLDYEHATLGGKWAAPDGRAPAAAWIKSLTAEIGAGLWGNVEWTKGGAEAVREKEYRYLSPVVLVRKADNRVIGLHSVALTNKPAIAGMSPIVNKAETAAPEGDGETVKESKQMDKMMKALGLADGADETAGVNAIEKLKADAATLKTAHVAVCKAMSLAENAEGAEVVAAVSKLATPPAAPTGEVVPRAQYEAVLNIQKADHESLVALETREADRTAGLRIASAKSAGKLSSDDLEGAHKEYWQKLARDEKGWEACMANMLVRFPADGRVVNKAAAGGNGALAAGGPRDVISAHREQFAEERIGDYERIAKHAADHKVSFEEAMKACGAL